MRCDWRISINFVGQLVVAVSLIDSCTTGESFVEVEVQSPYVIERRSKGRLTVYELLLRDF